MPARRTTPLPAGTLRDHSSRRPATTTTKSPELMTSPSRPAPRELLSLAQVLAELGDERGPLARSTFDDWRTRGVAPRVIKLPNGQLRIDRTDLDAWIDSRTQDSVA